MPRGRALSRLPGNRANCGVPVKTGGAGGAAAGKAKTTAKHKATSKHTRSAKQVAASKKWAAAGAAAKKAKKAKTKVTAKAKPATHAKAKALAVGDAFAVCTIEALAASLRLQGLPVDDADVLALFRVAGGDDDRGMPVRAALEAAGEHGLAGIRLARFEPADLEVESDSTLILGVELPGQHTVLATADGWWSWGWLWDPSEFRDAVIDEAWAVTWAVAA